MEKSGLILKRASASRSSGEWSDDDFDVLADGAVVGRAPGSRAVRFARPRARNRTRLDRMSLHAPRREGRTAAQAAQELTGGPMLTKQTIAAILAGCVLWSMPARCETIDMSANAFMSGCRFVIEPDRPVRGREMQLVYDGGRCNGFVSAIALTDLGVCVPAQATIDQMVRVVVRYVGARPARAHEFFATLAQEALRAAWPCKR
jgi:Rap1a immunity proteins